jgi:hypothetical protein
MELGVYCDCGGFDGYVVMAVVMVMVIVVKIAKVNLVMMMVMVEEKLVGSIFRVNTAATGCSET